MEPPSSAKEVREQTSQDAVKKVLQLTRQGWTVDTSKLEPELRPLFVRRVEHYRGRRLSALGNTVDHFVEVSGTTMGYAWKDLTEVAHWLLWINVRTDMAGYHRRQDKVAGSSVLQKLSDGSNTAKRKKSEATVSGFRLEDQRRSTVMRWCMCVFVVGERSVR
ncbi:hypothetical protein T4D_10280 [Trichinella pseudospiralis]|uniref:Uncharacterized protein n=1 Tax=Trichinella pseudospiralis TaxID=6337 RepID=A0A0V1G3W2_TRIPS|nr:hypothetical protein T4D_10280 [Trichinella pseudospiralis]